MTPRESEFLPIIWRGGPVGPEGDKTRVKFDLTVDPKIPVPGFVMRRAIKGAMNDATDGLRKRVLSLKKGR